MVQMIVHNAETRSIEREYATFYLDDVLLGLDIRTVQEINRNVELTRVPNAPPEVKGVMNLRGEVCTVIDLRTVFGMSPQEISASTRNLVVTSDDERIGLLVDRIADVVTADDEELDAPPGNLNGIENRFFSAVHKLDKELLLIVDVEEVLAKK
jgi:purine-binding chemotaxis protein CheW